MNKPILVRDVMTAPVTTLPPTARLLDVALTLRRTGFRHLVVVDGDRLVGVVSDRDVHRYAPSMLSNITPEEYNAVFAETPIQRVMTPKPFIVTPNEFLFTAAALMHEHKLGCLPVVEEDRLVGLVTVTDLLAVLTRLLTPESQSVPAS